MTLPGESDEIEVAAEEVGEATALLTALTAVETVKEDKAEVLLWASDMVFEQRRRAKSDRKTEDGSVRRMLIGGRDGSFNFRVFPKYGQSFRNPMHGLSCGIHCLLTTLARGTIKVELPERNRVITAEVDPITLADASPTHAVRILLCIGIPHMVISSV